MVLLTGNVGPAWAHSEEQTSRWGEGADRVCNVVVDSDGEVVVQTSGEAR
jgi:hypothetical protein